jgi:hypothetical protein
MSTCPNCKKTLSCGCQRRTATNKAVVCSSCLNSYEKTLKPQESITNPQTLSERGNDRYKNLNKFIK